MSHHSGCSWIWPLWMGYNRYGNNSNCNDSQFPYCHLLLLPWRLTFLMVGVRAHSLLSSPHELSQAHTSGIAMSLHTFHASLSFSHDSLSAGPRRLPLHKLKSWHMRVRSFLSACEIELSMERLLYYFIYRVTVTITRGQRIVPLVKWHSLFHIGIRRLNTSENREVKTGNCRRQIAH